LTAKRAVVASLGQRTDRYATPRGGLTRTIDSTVRVMLRLLEGRAGPCLRYGTFTQ